MGLHWGFARSQHTGSQSYRDLEAKSTMAGESSHIRVAAKFVSLRLKYTNKQTETNTKHQQSIKKLSIDDPKNKLIETRPSTKSFAITSYSSNR